MRNERVIEMYGNVTRSVVRSVTRWAVNFQHKWHTLTVRLSFSPPSIKRHVYLELEIKRNQ